MFGKLMNRYYYGKSGKGDYTPDDLPQTRMQLFWETLRVRFASMVKLNLLYMLFWLPAMIVIGLFILGSINTISAASEMLTEAGEASAEFSTALSNIPSTIMGLLSTTVLFLIPAITLTGPFTAGAAYVTRNWARDEHSFIWSDFKDAVKANWKQGLLTSFITSLIPTFLYFGISVYSVMAKNNALFYVPEVFLIMLCVLWLCSLVYMYPQMVTYELSYKQLVKNSLIMTVGRLPITLGIKLLSLLPTIIFAVIVFFWNSAIGMLVYALWYVLIGFILSRFIGAAVSNAAFDKYLNPNIEGAKVNQGLYVEDPDDDEGEDSAANLPDADNSGDTSGRND